MKVLRRFWPLTAVVALLVIAGFAAATGSLPLRPAPLQGDSANEPPPTWDPHLASAKPPNTPGAAAQRIEVSPVLIAVVQAVCLLVVVGVIVLLVVLLVRGVVQRRVAFEAPGVRPTQRQTTEEMLAAVDQGLVELDDDGDPRRAVIACWVRLERAAQAAGVERKPGDTSTDLVVRLFSTRSVNHTVLNDFAAVYREARYSPHPVTAATRDDARAALRLLRDELGAERAV
ncbi:MAG: DUF4129 domain-containing protein [Hamadaea sp.]|uniref:DUF4129 domain-containing protein n=1 Tax=Hamadaea sp. TaxID=2024425 RepID=UPI00180C5D2A|nr:DUF4129 domain-containing protein [Hamadaea sp.]NUR47766.1 DUF4129 domain-containing protein [Hamadaea sp.]NUR72717.1 DUF4129 domain-containing protein [Hamadaea sp.]NUT22324.1 DUF4129 domain-containing protein [Hamadaea sp.]